MGKIIDYETELSHRKSMIIDIAETEEEERKKSSNRLVQYFQQQRKLEKGRE
ncbi:MAG: hypothetical protein OSJ60_16580 [Lachnospiraceae bacterium]|nr:hypothetical protein [Lachnospiraceae bacterium]